MKPSVTPRHLASVCLISIGLAVFSSCKEDQKTGANNPKTPPPIASASWPATRTTDGGNFDVTINPEGDEILRNKHFALDLGLKAKDGDTSGITVAVDADMPAHRHGMNTKPEVSAIDGGTYRAEGMLFHMAGEWVIMVDVTRGDETERASFSVSVE
jgi:hypothetical protein